MLDADTLDIKREMPYPDHGWGLTNDGANLITSNGTDTLTYCSPLDLSVIRTIKVNGYGKHWDLLNELEYVDGTIWANKLREPILLSIDSKTGDISSLIDLRELYLESAAPNDRNSVANGIAYDRTRDAFWVTGKKWEFIYLIKINGIRNQLACMFSQPYCHR